MGHRDLQPALPSRPQHAAVLPPPGGQAQVRVRGRQVQVLPVREDRHRQGAAQAGWWRNPFDEVDLLAAAFVALSFAFFVTVAVADAVVAAASVVAVALLSPALAAADVALIADTSIAAADAKVKAFSLL